MESLTAAGVHISKKDLAVLNRCRIHLQVFYMYDIAVIDGDILETWALPGK
jgi:hypothetical protein